MYDPDITGTSKGALAQICRALSPYKNDIVLAGGWVPYFLTRGFFDHCGSIDVDFVLKPAIAEQYERIEEIIRGLGYQPLENMFSFGRSIHSSRSGKDHWIKVDFLTEPEDARSLLAAGGLPFHEVQEDLRALISEGSSIVFTHNQEMEFEAVTPQGYEVRASVRCADMVGSLSLKGLVLYREKDKDSYDIYAIAGFYNGGPKQAARAFTEAVVDKGGPKEITLKGIEEIKDAFSSATAQGPAAVSKFIENEDAAVDAYLRMATFLEELDLNK